MKAAVRSKYGAPDVLSIQEVEKPTPKDDEVLVKIHATTVNRSDYHVLTGKPFIMRFFTGLFKPKLAVTGSDFAGQIQATGKNAKLFKVSDKVMGFIDIGSQSHAQYLIIPETKVIFTPSNVTYEQAVACLEGAFYALSGIQRIRPEAGQNALVIGATGAIGSSYVQFLKIRGVDVTAVCGAQHSQLVKSLGARKIIDYKTEDFTKDIERYDIVLDAVGKSSFTKCKHLLKAKGIYASSQPNLIQALVTPLLGGKKVIFPIPKNLIANLKFIKDLVEEGNFRAVIDRTYPLDKIADAYTYVATGQKIGNVIITMENIDPLS